MAKKWAFVHFGGSRKIFGVAPVTGKDFFHWLGPLADDPPPREEGPLFSTSQVWTRCNRAPPPRVCETFGKSLGWDPGEGGEGASAKKP